METIDEPCGRKRKGPARSRASWWLGGGGGLIARCGGRRAGVTVIARHARAAFAAHAHAHAFAVAHAVTHSVAHAFAAAVEAASRRGAELGDELGRLA